MHPTPRFVPVLGAWLAAVVLLAGCSAITSITGSSSDKPGSSGAAAHGTPNPSSQAWPAKFQDGVCGGLASLNSALLDLNKLADAADAGDFAGASKWAKSALTKMKAADAALKAAPVWKPSADMLGKFRNALKTYVAGLTDLEKGARTRNASLLLQSLTVLSSGTALTTVSKVAEDALQLTTGFSCP